MPIDPISLLLASFINGIAPQLLRKFLPAGADRAQLEQVKLKREEMDIRREEIAAAERRYLDTQKFQRDLKFEEIERNYEMTRKQKDYEAEIQRWPLKVLPNVILKASEAHGGRSLNVILNVVDTHDQDFYRQKQGEAISQRLDLFHGQSMHVVRSAVERFSGDVILYHEVSKTKASGNSLKMSLWNLLQTEPTILVEINMSHANEVVAYVSQWGCAFEPTAPVISYPPQTFNLAGMSGEGLEKVLGFWLSSLVVSIGDAFRTLHRPYVLNSPVYPAFIQENAPEAQRTEILYRMLNTYTAAYDGVAMHSPLLASELAAQAALTAQELAQSDFAEALLKKALSLHPAFGGSPEIDDHKLALLRKQGRMHESVSPFYKALKTMRNVSVGESKRSQEDFEVFIRSLGAVRKETS